MVDTLPWQVKLAQKSIKKMQKIRLLQRLFPDCSGKRCIEIGAEKGVVNYYLRSGKGGRWTAATLREDWVGAAEELLKEGVENINPEKLPYEDASFDVVLASRPEHIEHDDIFFNELDRVVKPGGELFFLSPHVGKGLFLNTVKNRVGLTMEKYDHYREGYDVAALASEFERRGYTVVRKMSYSRFFSESLELSINALYSWVNEMKEKKKEKQRTEGEKAVELSYRPTSSDDINKNKAAYIAYQLLFPFMVVFSKMDYLLPFTKGYVLYLHLKKK